MKTIPLILITTAAGILAAQAQTGADPAAGSSRPEEAPRVFSKPFLVPDGVDIDKLKDAAQQAATDVWKGYVGSIANMNIKSFAVLPLQRDIDGEYVALQLRNKFTEVCGPQGLQLYTRMDQEWNTLLKEIAWGENFGDTMDQTTIQKFGRIKGVQALVFPRLTGVSKTDKEGVKLRLNVQVFEVETGQQLWGKEIVTTEEGSLVPVVDPQIMRDYRQWIIYGGAALALLLVVSALMKFAARAARPR